MCAQNNEWHNKKHSPPRRRWFYHSLYHHPTEGRCWQVPSLECWPPTIVGRLGKPSAFFWWTKWERKSTADDPDWLKVSSVQQSRLFLNNDQQIFWNLTSADDIILMHLPTMSNHLFMSFISHKSKTSTYKWDRSWVDNTNLLGYRFVIQSRSRMSHCQLSS